MVWCGAILPLMHRHQYLLFRHMTLTRPWHKAYEYDMKRTSSSDAGLSRGNRMSIFQAIAPLSTKAWDDYPAPPFWPDFLDHIQPYPR